MCGASINTNARRIWREQQHRSNLAKLALLDETWTKTEVANGVISRLVGASCCYKSLQFQEWMQTTLK